MTLVLTIIKLIIVLAVVATIHEFGHFIIAKLFKMKVDEFAIGFGKAIFQKKYKDTTYSLRWIPLGGYCALDGEDKESDDENSFAKKAPWKRILVLLAGATFNAILAASIFLAVNFKYDTFTTEIKSLKEDSILREAGIQEEDIITKIGDTKTYIYQDILLFNDLDEKDIVVEYIRDGKENKTVLKDAIKKKGYMGVYFDTTKLDENGNVLTYLELVEPGKPASDAGIKTQDKIIKVNGKNVRFSYEVTNLISQNAEKEVEVVILRGDEEKTFKLVPKTEDYIDFGITDVVSVKTDLKHSYFKSRSSIKQIIGSYVDLFKGKVEVTQLSGIVGIGETISRTEGLIEFLNMMGIISLAVGVANILPFPPLDGGKIVLVLIEKITRKKVSYKTEAIISYIGFGLLIVLTIYVTINDIIRII